MSFINEILLAPINNLNREDFFKVLQKSSYSDRKFFLKKILHDKFSPIFINYINDNQLHDLFDNKELESLRNQSKRFQIQSLEIVKEVIHLNKLFKNEGLNPTFLKGVALMSEYSDISLRPAVDIDVLFDGEEVFDADAILKKNNYKGLFFDYSRDDLKKYIKDKNHLPHLRRNTNITVELHNRVTLPQDFKDCPLSNKIIRNQKSINFYGENIFIPSINDLVVHLLIHFSLNSNFKNLLRVFSDIAQIEKNYEIDWNKIYQNCRDRKIRKALSLSLEVLNYYQKLTNNFIDLKKNYKEFFPVKETVLIANKETFSLKIEEEKITKESLYQMGKARNVISFFKIVWSKFLPKKNQLIIDYRVSNPNNFKIIYFSFFNIFSRIIRYTPIVVSIFFKRGLFFDHFKDVNQTEDWLNS